MLARARGLDLNNSPQSSEKCLEYTDLPSPGPFAASTKDLDYCITRVRDVLLVPSLVEHLPVVRALCVETQIDLSLSQHSLPHPTDTHFLAHTYTQTHLCTLVLGSVDPS